MKIKRKIFFGFFTLVLLLAAAAAYSIFEFYKISSTVNAFLDNNYMTIQASKNMMEAVEREDSGILLLLIGDFDNGRRNINIGDSLFLVSYKKAMNNLTEDGEEVYLDSIDFHYQKLKNIVKYPIVGTIKQGNVDWYNSKFHPVFLDLKKYINQLMILNQTSMYREAKLLEEKAKRAIMPAIVSIIAGIIFTLIFNYLINYFYLSPLKRIINKINISDSATMYTLDENAIDELKDLDMSIRNVIDHKKSY